MPTEIPYTTTDLNILKELTDESSRQFAVLFNIPVSNLSGYSRSELAIMARIAYNFLTRDYPSAEQRAKEITSKVISAAAHDIAIQYRSLTDYRYHQSRHGLSVNSDLSFSIEITLTMMIQVIAPLSKENPNTTLLPDLFSKFYSQALGMLKMLNLNLAPQAYSIWRTLHEAECVIKLLAEGGKELQDVYLRHIVYNNAFRHAIPDQKQTDEIFVEIKSNMSKHGLKSKDMKKYIEYGWLYACRTYDEKDVNYKLNFRNGLQKAARLEQYNDWYEMASEIAHSSPIFFYSNNSFFEDLTIYNLTDITLRSIGYFRKWTEANGLYSAQFNEILDVYVNYLSKQSKKVDDSFYTKYKDYLEEPEDSEN